MTTNEPLRRLPPAVVPARGAWAQVEFSALARDEANAWLAAHGAGAQVEREEASLAERFALVDGREPRSRAPAGFSG